MVREPLAAHPGSGGSSSAPGQCAPGAGCGREAIAPLRRDEPDPQPTGTGRPGGRGVVERGATGPPQAGWAFGGIVLCRCGRAGAGDAAAAGAGVGLGSNRGGQRVALTLGIAIWLAPWDRWPRRASLALVPPAFALIAMGNVFSGADLYTYGVFFVVAFVVGRPGPSATHVGRPGAAGGRRLHPAAVLPARHPGVRADLGGDHHPGVCAGRGGNRVGRGQAGADRAGPGAGTGPGRAPSRTR